MAKQYKVLVNTGKADNNKAIDIEQHAGDKGQPVRIKAQAGARYQLQELGKDKGKNTAPDYVRVKRNGKHLEITFEDGSSADVIIEDYYGEMPAGYNGLIGQAENGSFYEYIPEDPNPQGLIAELRDGARATSVALGAAEVSPAGAAVAVLGAPMLGALGLLGAGAAAAYYTGQDTGTGAATGDANTNPNIQTGTPAGQGVKTAVSLEPIAGDNILNAAEAGQSVLPLRGKVTGQFAEGDLVLVQLNGHTYTVTVGADGSFSVPVSVADLKADADTRIEVTVQGSGGDTATAAQDYVLDTGSTPTQTALWLDPVAGDNVLSPAETAGSVTLTGKVTGPFSVGDTVTVMVNGKPYSGKPAADGRFGVAVPGSELAADPDTTIEATITGTGGTPAAAVQDYALGSPAVQSGVPVTGHLSPLSDNNNDGKTNPQDSDHQTSDPTPVLTGTVPVGSTASVTLDGVTYPVTVAPDGSWSFTQPTHLPDGTYYPVLSVTTNGVSTPSNLTPFTIDTTAPAVVISSALSVLASGQSAPITFTFSEPVSDFVAADVLVTGGALSALAPSASDPLVWTATFTPDASAPAGTQASLSLASGKFMDAAGNLNSDGADANNQLSLTVNAAVTGALDPSSDSGVRGDGITSDSTPTLAGKVPAGSTATVTIDGQTYPVSVAPGGSWAFTQPTNLPDGTYTPVLNVTTNGQTSTTALAPFTIDTVPPGIDISSGASALQPGQSTSVTFTLSEASGDFTLADIAVSGGTLSNLQPSATHPLVYTATFTPDASGTVATLSVASGKFSDAAGNLNTDGAETGNHLTLITNAQVTGQLAPQSDNATGIPNDGQTNDATPTLEGKVPAGSTASVTLGGQTYPVTVAPDGSWAFTQPTDLPDGTYTPILNVTTNGQTSATPITPFTIDTTAPTIALGADSTRLGTGQSAEVTFTLSEASGDFTLADIEVVGGTLGALTRVSDTVYSATFTPASGALVAYLKVASSRLSDAAGNLNSDGDELNNRVDFTLGSVQGGFGGIGSGGSAQQPAAPLSYGDNVGSVQSPSTTAPVTDDTTPALNIGTVPTGQTPALYVDGVKVPATYNPATGTLTPTTALAPGAHQLAYSLTDAAGTESPVSSALPLTIDTTAPAKPSTPTTYADNAGATQNPSSTAPSTDDTTPALNIGAVPAGQTPALYVDGAKVPATYDPVTGTLTPTTPLSDGPHQLAYTLTDPAGNESPVSSALPVTVDTTAPAKPATPTTYADNAGATQSPASTAPVTDDTTPALNIGTVPTGQTPALYVDGQKVPATYDPVTGTLTPTTALADGPHQLAYTLTDPAGNESPVSSALPLTVDTTAPAKPATPTTYADNTGDTQSPSSTAPTTDDSQPALNIGNVPEGTTPALYVDGQKVPATYDPATGTLTPSSPLSDGPHQLAYTLTDPAGNESPLSSALPVTVDTTAPAQPSTPTTYADNTGATQSPSSTAPSTDDTTPALNIGTVPTGSTPTLYVDGQEVAATYDPTTGTLTPSSPLPDGPHQLAYTLTDPAGNESPLSSALPVTVDTTAPAKPSTPTTYADNAGATQSPSSTAPSTDDTTPSINIGAVPAGTTPTLLVDGQKVPATYDPTTGTLTPSSPLSEGAHQISYALTDAAGNTSAPSAPMSLTVDSTAPTMAITSNQASLFAGQTATITFTLSEASTDFAWNGSSGDITVTGGTLSALTQSSTNPLVYTATFTPNANSTTAGVISVASGKFSDATGNFNSDGAEANNTVTLSVNTVTSTFSVANDSNAVSEDGAAINGNVITNDALATGVSKVNFAGTDTSVTSAAPATVAGTYGQLVLSANGSYTYTLDNTKSAVQALAAGQKVSEVFTYTATDGAGLKDALLTIHITGTNDAPVLSVPLLDQSVTVGKALAYTFDSGSFTDVDTGESKTYSATLADGSALPGWLSFNPATRSFSGTPSSLNIGTLQVKVTATDSQGATASDTFDLSVNPVIQSSDTTAPLAPTATVKPDGSAITGQAEPGSTVTAYDASGNPLGSAVADASGNYSIPLSPALTNGEDITAVAQDPAGNESQPTAASAPDTTDPAAPSASVSPNGSAVTGSAEPGSTVTVFDDNGKPLGSAVADANGNYSIALSPALTNGEDITAVAQDPAGNESQPTAASAPDTTAPTIAISSNQASLSAGQTATITFTLSEASSDFSAADVTVSGGTLSNFAGSGTTYTATFTPTPNSTSAGVISVASGKFSDAAGNFNTDGAETNNTVTVSVNTSTTSTALSLTPDSASIGEAGGTTNGSAGSALASTTAGVTTLNVLGNDSGSSTLSVSQVNGDPAKVGTLINGLYGQLKLNADGSYTYTLTETNPTVEALRTSGNTLVDVFTYTATDGSSSANSTLTITVTGANDAPGVNTPLVDTSTSVGNSLAYTFDSASFKDVDTGDSLSYTAQLVDASGNLLGGGNLPSWLSFNAATRTFSGTPTSAGDVYVRVTATDLGGLSASDDFKIAVGATNKVATIDITSIVDSATSSSDTGSSATDFVTSDRSLSFKGTVTGWTPGLGDQVKLELYTEPGGVLVGSAATITPAADGSWTWNHTATQLDANAQYKLRATIVDSSGNPVSVLAPTNVSGNLTGGVYDEQIVTIDTSAANADINLAVSITTDADNSGVVNASELAGASTFTARATFDSSKAKAGDTITLSDGSTSVDKVLSATDVVNGHVETAFAKPADGVTQTVTAKLTDRAGNVAPNTVSDSASLDAMAPTIAITSDKMVLKKGETATLTFTLSEASTDFVEADVAISGGQLSNWTKVSSTVYTATFTPTDNVNAGSGSISVASNAFSDAAGNPNADGAEANNKVDISYDTAAPTTEVKFSSMTKDTSSATANADWTTADASAGRLLSGHLTASLQPGETLEIYANGVKLPVTPVINGTSWEVTDLSGYNASWTYTAKVVDAAGNAGTVATQVVNYDNTVSAPVITAVSNGSNITTGTGNQTGSSTSAITSISGTSSEADGTVVYVYDNTSTNLVGTATVTGGTWTLGGLNLKSSGSNAFMALQVDANGNTSALSNSHTVTLDVNQTLNGDFSQFPGVAGFATGFAYDSPATGSSLDATNGIFYRQTSVYDADNTYVANAAVQTTNLAGSGSSSNTINGTAATNGTISWVSDYGTAISGNVYGNPDGTMTGNALIANIRAADNYGIVWQQNVTVEAGKTYTLTFDYMQNDADPVVFFGDAAARFDTSAYEYGHLTVTFTAATTGTIPYGIAIRGSGSTVNQRDGGDLALDNLKLVETVPAANSTLTPGGFLGATNNDDTSIFYTAGSLDTLAGNDTITATSNKVQTALEAGGFIDGGAGVDTLKLASGTTLDLATVTNNQTVKPIQEVEVFQMTGGTSKLTMTANNVLSLGGTELSGYSFTATTQTADGSVAATGSTSSTGKVQMVIKGQAGDTLDLGALANDGVTTSGVLGNTGLAGQWNYKGQVTIGATTYKVYDHSTTNAQVLVDVPVNVNTLRSTTITAISDDTGASTTDFFTSDNTLSYTGGLPAALGAGESVKVQILAADGTTVLRTGTATVNGTNWTWTDPGAALPDGKYTIKATIVDASGNQVAAYGANGVATQPMEIDATAPTQTLLFSSMTKDSSNASANADWTTADTSAGRLVSGSISAPLGTGEKVAVYTDNGTTFIGYATVNGQAWEITDTKGYTSGWTYTAKVVDAVGNAGTVKTQVVNADTTVAAPVIDGVFDTVSATTIANNGTTTNALTKVTGTGEAGSTIYLYDNSSTNLVGTAVVGSDGKWSVTNLSVVGAGSNTFSAVQVDGAGNQSVLSNLWSVSAGANNQINNGDFALDTNTTPNLETHGFSSGVTWEATRNATTSYNQAGIYAVSGWPITSTYATSATGTTSGISWSNRFSTSDANTSGNLNNPEGAISGNVLGANIVGNTKAVFWSTVVQVEAGKTYTFSLDYSTHFGWGTMGATINGVALNIINNPTTQVALNQWGRYSASFVATTSGPITLDLWSLNIDPWHTPRWFGDIVVDNVALMPLAATNDGTLTAGSSVNGATPGNDSLSYTSGVLDTLGGGDTITATATDLQAKLAAGGRIVGGSGIDILKLAAGTTLDLTAITNNQTVKPIQEVEVFTLQGTSKLVMSANDVLSLGGSNASTMSSYTFASTTQGSGATGSTSSTGKVQFVVNGTNTDTLSLSALATDGVTTAHNVVGNTGLTGQWDYKGTVTLTGVDGASHTYKVYDHSTTQAQILVDLPITVDTLKPLAITAISTDSNIATDFITTDQTLVYSGSVPVDFNPGTQEVRVVIKTKAGALLDASAIGAVTVNGTNWTWNNSSATLAEGDYTIEATIVDKGTTTPTASYGSAGTTSQPMTIDTSAPNGGLAPTVEITTDANNDGSISGTEIGSATTVTVKAGWTGTVKAGDQVVLSDGTTTKTVTVSSTDVTNGYVTTTFAKPADGTTLTVTGQIKDAAGNSTSTASDSAYVDATSPTQTLQFTSMTKDSSTASATADWTTADMSAGRLVSGTVSAPVGADEKVAVYTDNGATFIGYATLNDARTAWEITDTQGYTSGWTYTAKVVDAAGNQGPVQTQVVNLETVKTGPVITSVMDTAIAGYTSTTVANGGTTNTKIGTVSGTGTTGDTVYLYDNSTTNLIGTAVVTNGTWSVTGLSLEGAHTFAAKQVSSSGLVSTMSNQYSVSANQLELFNNNGILSAFTQDLTYYGGGGPASTNGVYIQTGNYWDGSGSDASGNPLGFTSVTTTQSSAIAATTTTSGTITGTQSWVATTGYRNPNGAMKGNVFLANVFSATEKTVYSQNVDVVAGRSYKVKFDWFVYDASTTKLMIGDTVVNFDMLTVNGTHAGQFDGTFTASTTGTLAMKIVSKGDGTTSGGDLAFDNVSFVESLPAAGSSFFAAGTSGDDTFTATTTALQAALATGTPVNGGAGVDTLKLAAGTTLDLTAITNNQTVKSIQEVEVFTLQGGNSVLTASANDVLSLGAANLSGYDFTSVSNAQNGGTTSTGKVQMVVNGVSGDKLVLNELFNDGVIGQNGVLGNTGLGGQWVYKGDVVKNGTTYKVYDHSTTQAQVLVDSDITVDMISPIKINSISADAGASAVDFITNDPTLVYTGKLPSGFNTATEKVKVEIINSSNAVVYSGYATVNGSNWTWDDTADTLAAGNYTIKATVVNATSNAVVTSYGVNGSTTQALVIDAGAPVFSSAATSAILEGQAVSTVAYDATADADAGVTYTLSGADAALFDINASTGVVTFKETPVYAAPTDSGADNVYDVTVTATDTAGNATDKGVAITVVQEPTLNLSVGAAAGAFTGTKSVNGTTGVQDIYEEIATLSDGSYVVAWADSTNGKVMIQKYDANHQKVGSVMSYTAGYGKPQIVAFPDGSYVVGDVSFGGGTVKLFHFDSSNTLVASPTLTGNVSNYEFGMTVLSNGDYAVAWDGGGVIKVQKLSSTGTPVGATLSFDGTNTVDVKPQIKGTPDGGYVVVWETNSTSDIYAQKVDQNNNLVGPEARLTSTPNWPDQEPVITVLNDGSYAVAWWAWPNNGQGNAYVQKFNGDGTSAGNTITLSGPDGDASWDKQPSITALTDGGYVVAWSGYASGSGIMADIMIQRFDSQNNLVGSMKQIRGSDNNDTVPEITATTDGGYVVVWRGGDTATNQSDVYAQKYDASNNPVSGTQKLSGTSANGTNDHLPQVTALPNGGYAVAWYGINTGTNYDIFVQAFDGSGVPAGTAAGATGTFAINSSLGTLPAGQSVTDYVVTYTSGTLTVGGTTYVSGSTIPKATWESAVSAGTALLTNADATNYSFTLVANVTDATHGLTFQVDVNKMGSGLVSPLVIDLNGDGVHTLGLEQGVAFDLSGMGQLVKTGWVDQYDGLLAIDRNHDGQINSGAELFGSGTTLANGAKAADGWAALAGLDTNADGVINAMDAQFADLRVWRDADGDGVTDAGELVSLQDAGIASIGLAHDGSVTAQNGNLLMGQAVVTHTDGSTTQMTDAWLATEKLSGVEHPVAQAPALDSSLATLNLVGLNDVQLSLDNLGTSLVDLSGNAKPDMLSLSASDVLQLPATAAGQHVLEVTGDATDAVQLDGLWSQTGSVSQNGHTFNVYHHSTDQTLQVMIDQQVIQTSVHLS